jgi:hypothetical protein
VVTDEAVNEGVQAPLLVELGLLHPLQHLKLLLQGVLLLQLLLSAGAIRAARIDNQQWASAAIASKVK